MCPETSAELRQQDNGGILRELADHLDAMIAYWDGERRCVFANEAYRHWFGKDPAALIGLTMEQLLGPLYSQNLPYIDAAYQGRQQVFERQITTPDGTIRHSLATYTPRVVNGSVAGIFVHVADVGPLKQLEQQLRAAKAEAEQAAHHDFLTGLPNRVLLYDRIKQALAQSKRENQKVALISADIDGFKLINDNYGHKAGDEILVTVAARLQSSLRDADSVTRYGGDEFILLLPGVESEEQVRSMAGRVLERIREPVEIDGTVFHPACSFGIAIHQSSPGVPDPEPGELIVLSDRALYRAKLNGKDRLEVAELQSDLVQRDDEHTAGLQVGI